MKNKYIWVAIGISVLSTIILVIAAPTLFGRSYAQSQFANLIVDKTLSESDSLMEYLFSPSYIVFTIEDDYEVRANYVSLDRKYLLLWEVESQNYQNTYTEQGLPETEQEELAQAHLEAMRQAIISGTVSAEEFSSFPGIEERNRVALEQAQEMTRPGVVISNFSDLDSKYNIEVLRGTVPSTNNLQINGKDTGITNVSSGSLDLVGENFYYTKYEITYVDEGFEIVYGTGKIFAYDLSAQKESELYDFGQQEFISIQANDSYLVYVLGESILGKINIASGELVSSRDISEIVALELSHGDVILTRVQLINIGPKEAVLTVDKTKVPSAPNYEDYRVFIDTLELERM